MDRCANLAEGMACNVLLESGGRVVSDMEERTLAEVVPLENPDSI